MLYPNGTTELRLLKGMNRVRRNQWNGKPSWEGVWPWGKEDVEI